jgi:hypothetical protein
MKRTNFKLEFHYRCFVVIYSSRHLAIENQLFESSTNLKDRVKHDCGY